MDYKLFGTADFSGDCFSSETVGASIILACVANVSVGLRSKERPRNGGFQCFARGNNVARAKKRKEGEGKQRNACRKTPGF